jgi:aspartate racemase
LIGGPGVEVTAYYVRLIEEEIGHRYGDQQVPHVYAIGWRSPRFAHRFAGHEPELLPQATRMAAQLHEMGAEAVALCGSQLQTLEDNLTSAGKVISVCTAVGRALQKAEMHSVGIMGVTNETESKRWKGALRETVRDLWFPTAADQAHLGKLMEEEFERGVASPEARTDVVRIALSLRKAGARAVVTCAPELAAILADVPPTLPVFDSAACHVSAIVEWMARGEN